MVSREQLDKWRNALDEAAQAPDWREVDNVRYEMEAELSKPEEREWRVGGETSGMDGEWRKARNAVHGTREDAEREMRLIKREGRQRNNQIESRVPTTPAGTWEPSA